MLIRFKVKNFLSFKDEIEFSMVAGKVRQHPDQVIRSTETPEINLLKIALVYGANAAGKSNLVKAIDFAKRMVIKGVAAKAPIPRKPFKMSANKNSEYSYFEFEIKQKGKIYAYGFRLDSKHVHEEWLHEIRPKSEKILFYRITSADGLSTITSDILTTKKEKNLLELIALGMTPNRLFLHESIERNIKHFADVYEWFEKELVIIYPGTLHSLSPIVTEGKGKFGDLLVDYLRRFDTGIQGFTLDPIKDPKKEVEPELLEDLEKSIVRDGLGTTLVMTDGQRYFARREGEELKFYKLTLRHHDEILDKDIFFGMDEESDGTLRLLDLIPMLSPNLKRNSVVIIDELDRSLHPSLSADFISSFIEIGTQRQMIVTTHDANLLDFDIVRRDEIWFVEKDKQGSSSVYSLEEYAPRYDKDIRKGYMLGRFGAIPLITKSSEKNWG